MKNPIHESNSCESLTVEVNLKPLRGRKNEPVRLGEILPEVMKNIRNRMNEQRNKYV